MPIIAEATPTLRMAGNVAHIEPVSGGSEFFGTIPGEEDGRIVTFGDIRLLSVTKEIDTIFRTWIPDHSGTVDGEPAKLIVVKELGTVPEWRIRILRPGSSSTFINPAKAAVILSYKSPVQEPPIENAPGGTTGTEEEAAEEAAEEADRAKGIGSALIAVGVVLLAWLYLRGRSS